MKKKGIESPEMRPLNSVIVSLLKNSPYQNISVKKLGWCERISNNSIDFVNMVLLEFLLWSVNIFVHIIHKKSRVLPKLVSQGQSQFYIIVSTAFIYSFSTIFVVLHMLVIQNQFYLTFTRLAFWHCTFPTFSYELSISQALLGSS